MAYGTLSVLQELNYLFGALQWAMRFKVHMLLGRANTEITG